MSDSIQLHLIGNAHIDPVWLWDWREGLGEGIATCRTMVDLLREFPNATFIRGEAAIYEHIETHDPETFSAIRRLVREGRWDIVGGNYVQPDNNLPATEALFRQFVRGKTYFRKKFGIEVTAAWATDSFGHSAGLPDILASAGFDSFACTRPQNHIQGIAKPAFWWRGASGGCVLAWRPLQGWYGLERNEIGQRLDSALAETRAAGLSNGACFYGLGNHGGGPSRRHLREIHEWAEKHPEIKVVHSGLHRLFSDLRTELKRKGADFIPTVDGELNFCLRGCSASVAKFKYAYRKTQAQLLRAERTATILAAMQNGVKKKAPADLLDDAWDTLLFSAFHDILPGSSIERAYDHQLARLGGAFYSAQKAENDALLVLARHIDTRPKNWAVPDDKPQPVPVLVWNSHPFEVSTQVEVEVGLDYRPIFEFRGRSQDVPVRITGGEGQVLPYQLIADESDSLRDLPWRKRAVLPVTLPAFGWRVLHMGLDCAGGPRVRVPKSPVRVVGEHTIASKHLSLSAVPGATAVTFAHGRRLWLVEGLQIRLYEDPWGSWGGMDEQPESWLLAQERERWTIQQAQVLESGPERAALWVRFSGSRSQLDLTFFIARDARHIEVRARVLFTDRSARLKLVLPAGGVAEFDVPGGVAVRKPCGEVPGGQWVRAGIKNNTSAKVGFASDSLYGFDTTDNEFRATIVRSTRYAGDVTRGVSDSPWLPSVDSGELLFNFLITPDCARLPRLAAVLEEPLVALPVPSGPGELPASGSSLLGLTTGLRLLALRPLPDQAIELRLQNEGPAQSGFLVLFGRRIALGKIGHGQIVTWRLSRPVQNGIRWQASRQKGVGP